MDACEKKAAEWYTGECNLNGNLKVKSLPFTEKCRCSFAEKHCFIYWKITEFASNLQEECQDWNINCSQGYFKKYLSLLNSFPFYF